MLANFHEQREFAGQKPGVLVLQELQVRGDPLLEGVELDPIFPREWHVKSSDAILPAYPASACYF